MKFINQAEGYIELDGVGGYDYVYQYKDHLGNIRLSYSDADDNGVIHGASTQLFFDDFEAATGWDGSGASWGQSITAFDDTLTFDGDYSGRVYAAMGTSVAVHSNEWVAIDNDSDTDYVYTAWAYSESPIIRLGLGMKEDGEAGYLTLFDDILIFDEFNKWVYVEKRVTVPAHITSLNVRIECAAWENRVGNVWFDNVSIRRVNDPETVEIIEESNYYPFGLQHKSYNNVVSANANSVAQKYKYNGKELNDELGLDWYDYGARNYQPDLGRWMNLDPLAEKYTNLSPFSYVANNVVNAIDPDGRLIIFVGGLRLWAGNSDQRFWGKSGIYYSDVYNYWRTKPGEVNSFGQRADIVGTFARMHSDNHHMFTSGSSHWNSQADQRRSEGVRKAKKFYRMYKKGKVALADNETIKIVSHSQGGAHAAGFADQLMTYKDADGNSLFNVEVIYYITPHQPGDITHPDGPQGYQWSHFNDAVTNAEGWMSWVNGGSGHAIIKNLSSINQFFEGTILGGEGQPEATGAIGNRNGHNVTDNQQNIIDTLNDFCKQNPGKCIEIELVPNNANND